MNTIFGKRLGRYVLLEKLGEGGMAAVYNAYNSRMERNVALKVILPSRQSSQLFLDRFAVEARALAQLSHTNIVKVLDYGGEEGVPYLVMEFIQGGTLKEFLNQPYPYQQAAAILAPIARALDYVHKQKIIHRDVKPSNILIGENDQPMLSDFGVIKLLEKTEENDIATGVGIGTPDYMSPEQGMGKDVDFRADIYALGVVFYEMITGQKPFAADTPMAVVIQHVTGTFPQPRKALPKLPKIVEDVLMKAVAKEPNKRYEDMALFAEALEQLARGEKADGKRIRKLLHSKPKPRKPLPKRYYLYSLLALIALFVGATTLFWQQIKQTPVGNVVARYIPIAQPTTVPILSTSTPTPKPKSSPITAQATAQVTQTPKSTKTSAPTKPAPTQAPAVNTPYTGISLVGTEIPAHQKSINQATLREIALWGIGGINASAWSPDGKLVALATSDGVFIYDSQSLKRRQFIETKEWASVLLFTADGKYLTAGLRDGIVYIWDTITWQEEAKLTYQKVSSDRIGKDTTSPVKAIAYSKNQRMMAVGYENGAFVLYSISGSQTNILFKKEQYPSATGIYFSSDNRYIYSTNGDTKLTVWDISQTHIAKEIPFASPVSTIVGSSDGLYLLIGSPGGTVYLVYTVQERTLYSFFNLGAPVTSLDVSKDNKLLAFGLGNGKVKVFKLPNSEEIKKIQKEILTIEGHSDSVTSVAFSPDSKSIATTSWKDELKIWNTASGQVTGSLNENIGKIKRMIFSPYGDLLVIEDDQGYVRILNTKDGSLVQTFEATLPEGPVFSKSGRLLTLAQEAANIWENGKILIVESPSAKVVKTLTGYRWGWPVSFSPDEQLLVSGTLQSAYIWDTATWEKLMFHGGSMTSCGEFYTPENQHIAMVWNTTILFEANNQIRTICSSRPDFAQPLQLLMYQKGAIYQLINGRIWIWDLTEKEMADAQNVKKYPGQKTSPDILLALSNNTDIKVIAREGKDILVSGQSRGIVQTKVSQKEFIDRAVYQYTAAVSPDLTILALGSQFGTITFWTK